MALFNKSQKQMVLDLLVSENPGLVGVTVDNVVFVGGPVVISGVSTTLKLRGLSGAGFTGVKSFTYNRINLTTLFTSITPTLQQFTASTVRDLIPGFNAKYGLNLLPTDVVDSALSADGQYTINTQTTSSLMYLGSVGVTWSRGTKQIGDYYPNRTLNSLTIPNVMLKAFQMDFSSILSTLQAHDTTVGFSSGSDTAQAIVDALASMLDLPLTLSTTVTPGTGQYDLSGYTLSFTTPTVLTDANPRFTKIALLTPPVAYGNQYTLIYLHHTPVPTETRTADVISETELDGLVAPTSP